MASIEDVAKKARVSVTTVSRALNNHPYVSEKTKKKIEKAMAELNYFPNNVAQQLRGKKSKMIGVIISYITNPFFAYLVNEIEKTALAKGYNLVVLQTQGNLELEDFFIQLIPKKQLDGIIVTNLEHATDNIVQLIDEGKIILCNRYIGSKDLPVIQIDEEAASYQGTKFLIEKGHRKIAFCTGNIRNAHDHRFKGFLKALKEAGIEFSDTDYYENILGAAGGRQFLQKMMAADTLRPTAVFSNGDEVAAGIISEARKFQLTIPTDLAVLGFDDQPMAALTNPEITTIHQPIEEMGRLAAEALIAKIEEQPVPEAAPLETRLIIRESV
ncbi:LacI family DNA-binding transcriptional regulator [Enterococcus sp. LJL120]